jgi:hypothetical protein
MKLTAADLPDCSRAFLEACADSLDHRVAAGAEHLRPWLEQVRAAIPTAPLYDIDHRERYRR